MPRITYDCFADVPYDFRAHVKPEKITGETSGRFHFEFMSLNDHREKIAELTSAVHFQGDALSDLRWTNAELVKAAEKERQEANVAIAQAEEHRGLNRMLTIDLEHERKLVDSLLDKTEEYDKRVESLKKAMLDLNGVIDTQEKDLTALHVENDRLVKLIGDNAEVNRLDRIIADLRESVTNLEEAVQDEQAMTTVFRDSAARLADDVAHLKRFILQGMNYDPTQLADSGAHLIRVAQLLTSHQDD